MEMYGWERLICSYFNETCIDCLAEPLAAEGFEVVRTEAYGAVVFKRLGVFMHFGYELESAPNYSPTVDIGFRDQKYGEDLQPVGVPMWFVIGEYEPVVNYSNWTFSTEDQLRQVLIRIKAEVLDPYAKPLWQHPETLEREIARFLAKVAKETEEGQDS